MDKSETRKRVHELLTDLLECEAGGDVMIRDSDGVLHDVVGVEIEVEKGMFDRVVLTFGDLEE
jgi:hypothetical protein